jgi:hypothetical protein
VYTGRLLKIISKILWVNSPDSKNMKLPGGLLLFFVVMVVCIAPVYAILQDGVLKYDTADSGQITGTYGMRPWGHAVLFKNKDTITVTGIQLYGCQYGTGTKKATVEIWDKDLKLLYSDQIPYSQISMDKVDANQSGCGQMGSLADVPLPNRVVTGDFYVVVFTNSPKPSPTSQGMYIGFTTTSTTASSHTVLSNPNKFDELTIQGKYSTLAIDWIIRVYYTNPEKTLTSTPVLSLAQQSGQTITTTAPPATSPPVDQAAVTPPVKAETTKAPVSTSLAVIGVIISMFLLKKR